MPCGGRAFIVQVESVKLTEMRRILIFLLLSLCGCGRKETLPITHDAYIWQRRWDNAVVKAVRTSAGMVRDWRVLAAEIDGEGRVIEPLVNRAVLREMGKPVVAVVRVNGAANLASGGERVLAIAEEWRHAGIVVSGIEVDYDCPTDRLRQYRDYLQTLHTAGLRLAITALPSWLNSDDLEGLLAQVDEAVLQLHSVMSARKGLFDRKTADTYVRDWAKRSPRPFRVALPTYWSRVSWDQNGKVAAIESEVTRFGVDFESRELFVDPREVSGFVKEIQTAGVAKLAGFAWFRLPNSEDQRAWNQETWRNVMAGRDLPASKAFVLTKQDATGARDVFLVNPSAVDEKLPREVMVRAEGCELSDALPPYAMEREIAGVRFHLQSGGGLRSSEQKLIGWVRCNGNQLEGNVTF